MGYPYAPYLVSPYQHMAASESIDFRRLNHYLSSIRIRSEHAMAYLKGRFPALKAYRGLISSTDFEAYAHDFTVASLVAHNLAKQHDEAVRYLLYVQVGLDRAMGPADYDWFGVEEEQTERAAESQREAENQAWREQQQLEAQRFSTSDRDDIRIDAANERREELVLGYIKKLLCLHDYRFGTHRPSFLHLCDVGHSAKAREGFPRYFGHKMHLDICLAFSRGQTPGSTLDVFWQAS
ncbi:hypothetical protein V8E36_004591 [Tilletia maclaganii]